MRLRDLWVVLGWAGIITGMMVRTFMVRACFNYVVVMDLTDPCQSWLDYGVFFAAAFAAGMIILDERISYLGFVVVHIVASFLFFAYVAGPIVAGLAGPQSVGELANRTVVIDVRSQFPFPVFFSLIGSFLGRYFGRLID